MYAVEMRQETSSVYFASEANSQVAASEIQRRIDVYRNSLRDSGRLARMQRAERTYLGFSPDGGKDSSYLQPSGEQGELVSMTLNQFASLVNSTQVLITSARPAFKPIAANTDYSSLAQAQLADGLLEFYDRDLRLNDREIEATRNALIMSEGYVVLSWNPALGKEAPDSLEEKPSREGDIEAITITPYNVIYDPTAQDFDSIQWICFKRNGVNRWDLMARFPQLAEKIKYAMPEKGETRLEVFNPRSESQQQRVDTVDVWEFRHMPTPACPNGRLIRFIDDETVLFDTFQVQEDGTTVDFGYPYDDLQVYRIVPDTVPGTAFGHTPFFDCIGSQEAMDMVATIATTGINSAGLFNLWTPPGDKIAIDRIAGSMNLIQSTTKPEVILPPPFRPELQSYMTALQGWMRQRTGINDVAQGEYTKGMPAQAMALMQANAIQFNSKLQQSYQQLVERVRTGILQLLKRYANTTRVALMAGVGNTWQLKEFSKKDLLGVDRVIVEAVNPQSKTYAGKLLMADALLDKGMVSDAKQYITLVSTGQFKPLTDSVEKRNAFVQRSKEMLARGVGLPPVDPMTGEFVDDGQEHVRITIMDTHWDNIPEYASVLNDPGARESGEVVKAVTGIVVASFRLWRSMDPGLIMALGGRPCPPNADPAMVLPPDGDVSGEQIIQSGPSSRQDDVNTSGGPAPLPGLEQNMGGARMPSLPKPPKDPLGRDNPGGMNV